VCKTEDIINAALERYDTIATRVSAHDDAINIAPSFFLPISLILNELFLA